MLEENCYMLEENIENNGKYKECNKHQILVASKINWKAT